MKALAGTSAGTGFRGQGLRRAEDLAPARVPPWAKGVATPLEWRACPLRPVPAGAWGAAPTEQNSRVGGRSGSGAQRLLCRDGGLRGPARVASVVRGIAPHKGARGCPVARA